MDKYVAQLVEMIREAHENKPEPRIFQSFEEEMQDVESFLVESHTSLEFHFGISQDYFPPVEKLEEKHFDILVPEILSLWDTFRYLTSFPEKLPSRLKYQRLREELKKNHPLVKGTNGMIGIEWCHYDPKECPFPFDYCSCKGHYLEEFN